MLHLGEAELYKLFEPSTGGDADFDAAVRALDMHFNPQLNPDYECFKFRQAHQTDDESVDIFYAHLQRLASTCSGIEQVDEISANLIQGCKSTSLRKLI